MAIDRKTINQITSVDPNLSANGEFIVEQDGSTFKTAVSAIATYFGTVTGVQGSGINNNINDSNYSGIFAGDGNSMPFNTSCSFIGAGMSNIVEQSGAFIGAGCSNTIHSFGTGVSKDNNNCFSSIVAGSGNDVCSFNSHIIGGIDNTVNTNASKSFILGNNITANTANYTYVDNLTSSGAVVATNILSGGCNLVDVIKPDLRAVTAYGNETNCLVKIFPEKGRALYARSCSDDNPAVSVKVEGPVIVGHDLFKCSGFTGGFADGSNHFHDITKINLIEQAPEGDVKNLERLQTRYYAVTSNVLPGSQAAFLATHRVARSIDATVVDTSTATLDVSLLQNSSNRSDVDQTFFVNNTSPDGKSEKLTITLAAHSFTVGDQVRMSFSQSFLGPIVAADLFGKVTDTTTDTFKVELYGGNYKTTVEVPLGTDQTALTFDEVVLETVGTSTIVNTGNEASLQLYDKTNFTQYDGGRLKNETLSAQYSSAHGLKKNEHVTLITDGRGGLVVQEDAYVLDPSPNGDNNSLILVYGRRQKQYDLTAFTPFGSTNWTIHKGSFDGIHRDTLADNYINFNANVDGEQKAFQIGPGTQTDADAIAIGRNVYNKDASTIKIGYEAETLNIKTDGIVVSGSGRFYNDLTTNKSLSVVEGLSATDITTTSTLSSKGLSAESLGIFGNAVVNGAARIVGGLTSTCFLAVSGDFFVGEDPADRKFSVDSASGLTFNKGVLNVGSDCSTSDTTLTNKGQLTNQGEICSSGAIFEAGSRVCTSLNDTLQGVTSRGNTTTAGLSASFLSAGSAEISTNLTVLSGITATDITSNKIIGNESANSLILESDPEAPDGTNGGSQIELYSQDFTTTPSQIYHKARFHTFQDLDGDNKLIIAPTYLSATGSAFLSGDVGIGTTAPGAKLEVDGNIRSSGTLSAVEGLSGTFVTSNILSAREEIFEAGNRVCTTATGLNDALATCNSSTLTLSANSLSASVNIVGGGDFGNAIHGANAGVIAGCRNTAKGIVSFVGGGTCNTANGLSGASILGGAFNSTNNTGTVIGGGYCNIVSECFSALLGGCCNTIGNTFSIIGGGCLNNAQGSFNNIFGGYKNTVCSNNSSVVGGNNNCVASAATGVFILGSGLSAFDATQANTTFVNTISAQTAVAGTTLSAEDGIDFNGSIIGCNFIIKKGIIIGIN